MDSTTSDANSSGCTEDQDAQFQLSSLANNSDLTEDANNSQQSEEEKTEDSRSNQLSGEPADLAEYALEDGDQRALGSIDHCDVLDEVDRTAGAQQSEDMKEQLLSAAIKDPSRQPAKRLSSVMDIDQLARCQHALEDVAEVKSFTIALLELAFEKQTDIAQTALGTLQKLGRKHPSTVLRTLVAFLSSDPRPSTRVRSTILTVLESAVNPAIEAGSLDVNLAAELMKLALEEMVSHVESVPDIQLPASNLLVSIGAVYCKDVVLLLSSRLQTNTLPHPYILLSLASLATLNIYGTVPHLKDVLDTLAQILTSSYVKSNTLRRSFATAWARFSEAILFYLANMERAPDSTIERAWFCEDVAQAFEVLFLQWLPCKTPATCQEILEALGHMSQLLSKERLEQVAVKLLPALIQSYKGPVEALYVSRCFALFLDAFFNEGLELSEANVQETLNALFQQVTVQPDYGQPSTVKNHYEVLRCLERMARVHLERVVAFLLSKADQPAEKVRVAALTVLKHLINSLKELLEPHVGAIGAQMKTLTLGDAQSQSNVVKKALIQAIVAMAVQGHLLASDTVHSGRHVHLIGYLLKQCTLVPGSDAATSTSGFEAFLHPLRRESSDKSVNGSNAPSPVTNDELRQMCENVIQLLVTTQEPMEGLFWPLLLRHSLDVEYSRAMGTIARALAYLVAKKRPESESLIAADGPSSTSIVARFLVLARSPAPVEKCSAVLTFLKNFSLLIHPSLGELWQVELPPMLKQLKGNIMEQSANQNEWLGSLEKLADSTLARMKQAAPEWTQLLSAALFDQIGLYEQQPLERGFLLSLVGMAVHHGVVSKGPSFAVDFIMSNVRHQIIEESIGCASAMGWCSRSYLDVALLRLQNLERNDYGRRAGGFLGFMKENRSEAESDMVKSTAARCYRLIATETPVTELLLKVDKHVIRAVVHLLQSTKDLLVRQEGLEAVTSIAKAVLPERLQERYLLAGRSDLLKETLVQLRSTPLPDHIDQAGTAAELTRWVDIARFTVRALDAMAALVRLPPTLRTDDQSALLESALERGIPLYSKLCRFAKEECWMVGASLAANQLLMSLENLALQMLRSTLDPSAVDILFSQLLPWSKAQESSMRRAGLSLLRLTLATFVKEVEFEPGAPTRFSQGHAMLAKIVPRCTDPDFSVRDLAVDCLGLVLDTISKYMGYSRDFEKPTIERLEALKADLGSSDPSGSLNELATILIAKTPPSDLWVLLESMANGLADPFPSSSSGLSLVMCIVLKARGGEIHLRLKDLLDLLLVRLKNIETLQTRGSVLNGVCLLASHQRDTVVSVLLSHSLPHNEHISDCWKALAADPVSSTAVLDHLTDILTYAAPYEERGTGPHANESIVSWRLLSAISALKSMCQVEQISDALQNRFSQLFCVLILAQSCVLGASPPIHFPASGGGGDQTSFVPVNREAYRLNPYQMSVDVLKGFFTCAELAPLAEPLNEHRHATNCGDLATFCDLVANLTALCAVYKPSSLSRCIHNFGNALKSTHLRHRVAAVAFYAELIHQRASGSELDHIIRGLTSNLTDSSPFIRRIALKGLGGLSDIDPHLWSEFAPVALDALVDGLEESGSGRDSPTGKSGTALDALEGLTRLIPVSPVAEVERLASRLALRVRPFFEHEQGPVRFAAVSLLAQLFKVGYETSARAHLTEQVHTTLTSLLIHLNESDPDVVQACKSALCQAGPFMDNNDVHEAEDRKEEKKTVGSINAIFHTYLTNDGQLDYDAFLADLVKLVAVDCEDWVHTTYLPAAASYFKSPTAVLRANAALYVGLLCGVSSNNSSNPSQSRNICLSLTRLLHDPVKAVRLQAMNAISLMFS